VADDDLEAAFLERWNAAAESTGMFSNTDESTMATLREIALGAWKDGFNVANVVLADERDEALEVRDEIAEKLLELAGRYKAGLELLLTMPEHVTEDPDKALGYAFAALEAFQGLRKTDETTGSDDGP